MNRDCLDSSHNGLFQPVAGPVAARLWAVPAPSLHLCILPALVLYVLFLVYPTLNVFRMSLFDWNGLGNAPSFIGLDNFAAPCSRSHFLSGRLRTHCLSSS